MRWLTKFLTAMWTWCFEEKRSEHEELKEQSFIEAANKLKTLRVTERGGMFIDPEEIRDQILDSREALKRLVAPSHRRPANAQPEPDKDTKNTSEIGASDYVQIISWRRLPSNTAIRYVCLQGLNTEKFAIAVTDYFSGDEKFLYANSLEHRIAQRLKTTDCVDPLLWFDSLREAMDAHDASI